MRTARVAGVVLSLMLASGAMVRAGEAQPAEAGLLTLATERVVVFKDGFGLFVKKATGTADAQGRVFTDRVPDGVVLGTFWASSADGRALGMRAEWVETTELRETETSCTSVVELLRANAGKEVTLALQEKEAPPLVCTVVEVLDLPPEEHEAVRPDARARPMPAAHLAALRMQSPEAALTESIRDLAPRGGDLVVLRTEKGETVLPVNSIRTLTGAGLVTKMKRKQEVEARTKRLSFDLGAAAAGKESTISLLYFAEGVRWIPTYRIGGELLQDALIELQGEILNEAEDFDAEVDLVVGVPNFRYKQTISPLSLEATLRQALSQAAPGLMSQSYGNASFQTRRTEHLGVRHGDAGDGGGLDLAPDLAAARTQDLFVYSAKRLALHKGARATVPLWQSPAAVKHLYTMDVGVVRDAQGGGVIRQSDPDGQNASVSPMKLEENKVWHQIELANASKVPWTTGAALILKNNLPLGQDLLTYTPAGGKVLLPVTVAVDMCGTYTEEELSRRANALNWNRNQYAEVKKRATVTVMNQRLEPSRTRITVSLGGKVELASDEGKIRLNDFRRGDWNDTSYREINNHSDVSWELELKPGETKKLTFDFLMYLP